MRLIITIALLISFLSLCAGQSHEESVILSVIQRQIEGWNNGKIETFMQGYAQSDSLRFASGGTVTYGWKTMLDRYKKSYSSREKMGVLRFTDMSIEMVSADAAIIFGRWILKRKEDEPQGLFTLLFRKTNGEWRIVHDHTSSSP